MDVLGTNFGQIVIALLCTNKTKKIKKINYKNIFLKIDKKFQKVKKSDIFWVRGGPKKMKSNYGKTNKSKVGKC